MKVKMYKKIVSLVSAFSLAVTGLTGLSFTSSVSAAADPVESYFDDPTNLTGDVSRPEFQANENNYFDVQIRDLSGATDGEKEIFIQKKDEDNQVVTNVVVPLVQQTDTTVIKSPKLDENSSVVTIAVNVIDGNGSAVTDTNGSNVTSYETVYTTIVTNKDVYKANDFKWVVENEVMGKKAGNAKFRNETTYTTAVAKTGAAKEKAVKASYNQAELSKKSLAGNKPASTNLEHVYVGALKPGGKFNNTVTIKAVSSDYDGKGKGYEFAAFRVYINPLAPTYFKELNDIKVKGVVQQGVKSRKLKGTTVLSELYERKVSGVTKYELTIQEGQSFKLPYALGDGADKTLTYTAGYNDDSTNSCFTVVNGTVKALQAGAGNVVIASAADPSLKRTVTVSVTPNISAVTATPSSVALISRTESNPDNLYYQTFVINPKSSSRDANSKYSVDLELPNSGNYKVYVGGTSKTFSKNICSLKNLTGPQEVRIALASGKHFTKNDAVKIYMYSDGKKPAKPTNTVKISEITAPAVVKGLKETQKLTDKVNNIREVNVPLGSSIDLGVSVNPATADNTITWTALNGSGTLTHVGNVFKAGAVGTYKYQASVAVTNSDGTPGAIRSSTYVINVYKPCSSFVWSDANYKVKGDYLMKAADASTICSKVVSAEYDSGNNAWTDITFAAPVSNGTEAITWTSNKPGACTVSYDGTDLTIKPMAAGTYTITGTSALTKQKTTFKVQAVTNVEDDTAMSALDNSTLSYIDPNGSVQTTDSVTLDKGQTIQLVPNFVGVIGSSVVYRSSDAKSVSVSANGLVKAAKNDCTAYIDVFLMKSAKVDNKTYTVPADMTDDNIKTFNVKTDDTYTGCAKMTLSVIVNAAPAKEVKVSSVPKFAKNGVPFAAKVSNLTDPEWYDVTAVAGGGSKVKLAWASNKIQGVVPGTDGDPAGPLGVGVRKILPMTASEASAYTNGQYPERIQTITIYDNLISSVAVANEKEDQNSWKVTKAKDGTVSGGINQNEEITVNVKAMLNKTVSLTASDDSPNAIMTWTSSNPDIATIAAAATEPSDYATMKITANSKGYSGKVTFKGTTLNGNKTVTIVVDVNAS